MIILRCFGFTAGKNLANYGKDFILTYGDNYTHAIIYNPETNRPRLHIPKKNVVAFTGEAPRFLITKWNLNTTTTAFLYYCDKFIWQFLIGGVENTNIPNRPPFIGLYCSIGSGEIPKTIYRKKKTMSIIFSEKSFKPIHLNRAPGYLYRKKLVYNIIKGNFPVDIYGRGCAYLPYKDSRIKGSFSGSKPYETYQFTIAVENMRYPHYITEKFENAIRNKTIPIYLGCTKIEKYYPNCCIWLSGNVCGDILLIRDILKNPNKYLKDMDKAQEYLHVTNNIVRRCILYWKTKLDK